MKTSTKSLIWKKKQQHCTDFTILWMCMCWYQYESLHRCCNNTEDVCAIISMKHCTYVTIILRMYLWYNQYETLHRFYNHTEDLHAILSIWDIAHMLQSCWGWACDIIHTRHCINVTIILWMCIWWKYLWTKLCFPFKTFCAFSLIQGDGFV